MEFCHRICGVLFVLVTVVVTLLVSLVVVAICRR